MALFLVFDAARYGLLWARKLTRDRTVDIARRVERTSSSAAADHQVLRSGTDVTVCCKTPTSPLMSPIRRRPGQAFAER